MEESFVDAQWRWHRKRGSPCRIIECAELWGSVSYRVWLPTEDVVVRAAEAELSPLEEAPCDPDSVIHATAAAKLIEALDGNVLLAPMQTAVVPLPHQLYALDRAVARGRTRFLLADEVGLGKTIEAGLIIRELKLRGRAKRILVVAPKGLARQWVSEMNIHFGESFRFVEPMDLAALRKWRDDEDNLWTMEDQVICSLDSVKPMESRKGWDPERLAAYNRDRFEDLVSAGWDLVVIDEAHRLGGSTERVARYKLGAALAEAAPALLLLSATPHQGKTDQFLRLMQLVDREAFPDEASVSRDRVSPYVIRTEKRMAIDADAKPLFKPRTTRMLTVEWSARHERQRLLYEAVTDYVRHGYNRALAAKQRHIGFLMILMQRLVTSSTAAIRATLERRLAILDEPNPQAGLFDADPEEWADMDGQEQADCAVAAVPDPHERTEVETLLELARETEAHGTDAKAEALLETIYALQQEEGAPDLKVLIFTEFVPTQAMLAHFLENRGFSVVTLNGSMDLDARTRAQRDFAGSTRVLVSTDAGGEGLNLQFCHVVVNFDMPWNPMRIEQRIGRVDRIGQKSVVRALNLVLQDTVEHRVRQVLEEKLETILREFGIDKASDVMDSAEAEPLFDELFMAGIEDPSTLESRLSNVADHLRTALRQAGENKSLLESDHELDADAARKWRDHPAQYWLERAVLSGVPLKGGGTTTKNGVTRIVWPDGSETSRAVFDAKKADAHPDSDWITLEDPRARSLIAELPRHAKGRPVPVISLPGLPAGVSGAWSLWEISLPGAHGSRRSIIPVFLSSDGRSLAPAAKRIWDLLLTEKPEIIGALDPEQSAALHCACHDAAVAVGERAFSEMARDRSDRIAEDRGRAEYSFSARMRSLARIGLPAVKEHRRKRLEAEMARRMAELDDAASGLPELTPIIILNLGDTR